MVQCEFDTLTFEEEKKVKEMWALLNTLSKEDIIGCQSTCHYCCYLRHESVQLLCVCAVSLKYLKASCPISIAQ